MRKFLYYWLLAIGIGLLSLFFGDAKAYTQVRTLGHGTSTGNLVSVEWLKNAPADILVLDASPPPIHAAKHIPGAVGVNAFAFAGRDLPTPQLEALMQAWGISPGRKIVIYDQGGTILATTVFFELLYNGVAARDMLILDGGLAKWEASGGSVTKEATPPPPRGTFKVTSFNNDVRARLPAFLAASGDPAENALVEALEPEYYVGASKFFDRAGHVPNAIMLNADELFNADKTFKSAAEIGKMFTYLGIRPEQQIHTYCGGGQAATVPFFAAKYILNFPNVRVYKESQREWLRDERGLPFWTYAAPNLARGKQWLGGWTSPMLRMFGFSNVSMVDVRPAEAFKLGHVPASNHLPIEAIKANSFNTQALADAFSAARINPAEEAVVISEGGVTPRAALAYLMLEAAGQKKVSILMDSVDEWGLSGLPLEKLDAAKPPLVGPGTKPYTAVARPGLLLREPPSVAGLYPRVYIASGTANPVKARDGKTIHIPYASLLNADNTPKAAKDIWAILTKAGVPRYAEIICVADDAGDAAVNYFVLKMMGYPDVKVLVS